MQWIEDLVDSPTAADWLTFGFYLGVALAAYLFVKLVLLPLAHRAAKRSHFLWDDVITHRRLKHRLALLAPAAVAFAGAKLSIEDLGDWSDFVVRLTTALFIAIGGMTVSALLRAINDIYETKPVSKDRPIEAYIQLGQILVYLFTAVFVIAALMKQSPWFFASGLGAMTAILLLIFRDTILSFVASVQLVQQDLVDVGDWIEMPSMGADGDVIDVRLHTVTVQNFDKTIVSIPTSRLVTDTFRNWKGMAESGHRRIKRSLHLDVSTVRFLTPEEVDRLSRFEPLRDYMAGKRSELAAHAADHPVAEGVTPDHRRLTNIGTFRAYVEAYLLSLGTIDTDGASFLVRLLESGPQGIPVEIYCFARTTAWAEYERIQGDIFDHILAMIPEFGLRVFQEPTGADMRGV
jgi:miniconductance mechanosensitive channel